MRSLQIFIIYLQRVLMESAVLFVLYSMLKKLSVSKQGVASDGPLN